MTSFSHEIQEFAGMEPMPFVPLEASAEVSLSDLVVELQQENARLKRLVSELLLTNQRLRRED